MGASQTFNLVTMLSQDNGAQLDKLAAPTMMVSCKRRDKLAQLRSFSQFCSP